MKERIKMENYITLSEWSTYLDNLFVNGYVSAILAVIFLIIFILVINKVLNKIIMNKYVAQEKNLKRYKKIILRVILLLGIAAQFKSFSFIATSLLASSGVVAIMVGLASQEAASNIINGAFILVYKPYRINDYISIPSENLKGVVIEIGLRHTTIETIEKTRLIIPNQIMNSVTIENVNNEDEIKGNHLYLTISYDSDIDLAIDIIKRCAIAHPLCQDIRNKEEKLENKDIVSVLCTNFLDSSVELRATIYSSNNATGFQMLSDLRQSIKKEFDTNGIEIPFPHVVIKQ